MKIVLDTSRHCIETEMKRQSNKVISAYFKKGKTEDPSALESRIELLQKGLERFDFNKLRARYPELRSETQGEVVLIEAGEAGAPDLLINGEAIHAY
jgi:hypothetical protein